MPEDPNLEHETDPIEPETEPNPEQPIQPTAPAVDYEKKFSESTRENQLLLERNKALEQEAADRNRQTEPTESEYRTAFPTWDAMSDNEKDLARRTYGAEKTAKNVALFIEEQKAERSWNTSIELVIASNTALQGKEQTFRQFASQPKYRSVPMELLVDSFLSKNGTAPAPKPTPKPGLETGQGGPKDTPKPKGLSSAELGALRTSDPKKYQDYIKNHDITIED